MKASQSKGKKSHSNNSKRPSHTRVGTSSCFLNLVDSSATLEETYGDVLADFY